MVRLLSVLCMPALSACHSLVPLQALATTVPFELTGEAPTRVGVTSGKACRSVLLYIIALDSDASVFTAKARAVAAAEVRYGKQVVALVDVSVDIESTSFLVYEEICTVVRGQALAETPRSLRPNAPISSESPERAGAVAAPGNVASTTQGVGLESRQSAIVACLDSAVSAADIPWGARMPPKPDVATVKIRVSADGIPLSVSFIETLLLPVRECISTALKPVRYARTGAEHEVEQRYTRRPE